MPPSFSLTARATAVVLIIILAKILQYIVKWQGIEVTWIIIQDKKPETMLYKTSNGKHTQYGNIFKKKISQQNSNWVQDGVKCWKCDDKMGLKEIDIKKKDGYNVLQIYFEKYDS